MYNTEVGRYRVATEKKGEAIFVANEKTNDVSICTLTMEQEKPSNSIKAQKIHLKCLVFAFI